MSASICPTFYGFREKHYDLYGLPTKEEFLAGAPYFSSGDFSTRFKAVADLALR